MPDKPIRGPAPHGSGSADGLMPKDTRGAGGGGPLAQASGKAKEFRGGQSEAAYHGPGQLGEDDVDGKANPNAPSTED